MVSEEQKDVQRLDWLSSSKQGSELRQTQASQVAHWHKRQLHRNLIESRSLGPVSVGLRTQRLFMSFRACCLDGEGVLASGVQIVEYEGGCEDVHFLRLGQATFP